MHFQKFLNTVLIKLSIYMTCILLIIFQEMQGITKELFCILLKYQNTMTFFYSKIVLISVSC